MLATAAIGMLFSDHRLTTPDCGCGIGGCGIGGVTMLLVTA
jgi:hypothetical protein